MGKNHNKVVLVPRGHSYHLLPEHREVGLQELVGLKEMFQITLQKG